MRRTLLVLLGAGLLLAPAAAAKGPHAVLASGPEAVLPGVPWEATVELNEFRNPPTPLLIAFGEHGHVDAKVRRAAAGNAGAVAFKTTMVFPKTGRWKLMLVAGSRRFNLPALNVGSGAGPKDYVAFPVGSEAARPEVVSAAGAAAEGDGDAFPVWLLPILGVMLAGVGAAAVTRRGSR